MRQTLRKKGNNVSDPEVWTYIDSKPGWISLSSAGHDGYPHTVPIGYFTSNQIIYMGCLDRSQKVRNIQRNPKISRMLESGNTMNDIKGVLIKADAEVIRSDEDRLAISRLAALERGVAERNLPTDVRPGSVYIKATPTSVVSWDYSRG